MKKQIKKQTTSFYSTPEIRRQLDALCEHYDEPVMGRVIHMLIHQAYAKIEKVKKK